MALKNIIKPIPRSSRDSATFNDTLQLLSSASGIPGPCVILRIVNASNTLIGVSYDGVTVHDTVPANDKMQLEFQTNASPSNYVASLAKGTPIYVIGAAAGVGLVFLSGYYQAEGY